MQATEEFLGRDASISLVALALALFIGIRIREVLRSGVVNFGIPLKWYAERAQRPVDYWAGVAILAIALIFFLGIAIIHMLSTAV